MDDKIRSQAKAAVLAIKAALPKGELPEPDQEQILQGVKIAFEAFRKNKASPGATRENMDMIYEALKEQGVDNPRMFVAQQAEFAALVVQDPEILDYIASQARWQMGHKFVRALDGIARENDIGREELDKKHWGAAGALLDFDESKLDPSLTQSEKKYFLGMVKILQHQKEQNYLVSTPETAPSDSRWAKAAVARDFGNRGGGRGA